MPVEVCGGVLATGCSRGIGTPSAVLLIARQSLASLEEIIKSGEKVAKTSAPTGHSAGVPQARILPIQTLLNTGWVLYSRLLHRQQVIW